jgi:hypothetical protein
MTPEQRLNRLERIAKLMLRAGLRARSVVREHEEKLNILINAQIRTDELFAKNEERFADVEDQLQILIASQLRNDELFSRYAVRFARNDELFAKNDERFAKNDERFAKLADEQAESNKRLNALIEIMRKQSNGTA